MIPDFLFYVFNYTLEVAFLAKKVYQQVIYFFKNGVFKNYQIETSYVYDYIFTVLSKTVGSKKCSLFNLSGNPFRKSLDKYKFFWRWKQDVCNTYLQSLKLLFSYIIIS